MRKSDLPRLGARIGAAIGVILLFAGVFYRLEDGPNLRTWDELRLGKQLFFAGATIALVVPAVAFFVGLRRRRSGGAKRPTPRDDLT